MQHRFKLNVSKPGAKRLKGFLAALDGHSNVQDALAEFLRRTHSLGIGTQAVRAAAAVFADLVSHGWRIRLTGTSSVSMSLVPISTDQSRRDIVRDIQLRQRDRQLGQSSVRAFIKKMEKPRLRNGAWVSIFSLIRDGDELAKSLEEAAQTGEPLVPQAICPYLQVVSDADQKCAFTGFKLLDVWRYFRHTWSMPYNSVPGRSMVVLVRDAAAPNHPIMGIAGLGSSVVQMSARDNWIGWTPAEFVSRTAAQPSKRAASWILKTLDELINDIYFKDLIDDAVLQRKELTIPEKATVAQLRIEAEKAWKLHYRLPQKSEHKERSFNNKHWKKQAMLPLFRAKRAEVLAQLLAARRDLQQSGMSKPTIRGLTKALSTSAGRRALEVVLKYAKARHVGIDMLDITICGAVAPYNPILGGKLVAMLLCSPQIVASYRAKYRNHPSIIASSMAGRTIKREPKLVLLGTTSLYGERLNQYHRVQVPSEEVGGRGDSVRYIFLGESAGYGSSHLSAEAVAEIEILLAQRRRGRRVNSIFGEGVSPRLRKVRDGLDLLGLPAEVVLNHRNPRLIYGVPLATNFRDVLVGMSKRGKYILPQSRPNEVTMAIALYWGQRWLKKRLVAKPELIQALREYWGPKSSTMARISLPENPLESSPIFV